MSVIAFNFTKDDYGWMSNMHASRVRYKNEWWPTAEHLFQYLRYEKVEPKTSTNDKTKKVELLSADVIRKELRAIPSPLLAKNAAKRFRKLWPTSKQDDLKIMNKVVRLKLASNPEMIRKLINSEGDIYEDITERVQKSGQTSAAFWGAALQADHSWLGENQLGKIWMQAREDLQRALCLVD